MSDATEEFKKLIEEEAAIEKRAAELKKMKLGLEERKVANEVEKVTQNDRELQIARGTSFGVSPKSHLDKIRKDNLDYMDAAKKRMSFINETFSKVIPFFRKNLILIGGKTGEGKSTTVANIVRETIAQINPETGAFRRALVITNEEKAEDFYNRVTCLIEGWNYINHDLFSDAQKAKFDEMIPILAELFTVVDNTYLGAFGLTTTIEGICTIFDNLIRDGEFYDAILIDYYQNIKSSKLNPAMNEWEVQAMLAARLDNYKNIYPAPIVVMAQVLPPDKEKKIPFETRIKGRKVITDPSTVIMEMITDRENFRTEWVIHKSRFTQSVGESFHTGFDYGRFVAYDENFMKKINDFKERKQMAAFDKDNGLKLVNKDNKEDGENN